MPTPTDVEYFRLHTYRWDKPPPSDIPLETQAELFRKKDAGLLRPPDANDADSSNSVNKDEANLGDLAVLPSEVLHAILWHSDLQSVTNFRCLNHHCLSMVESLPAYRLVDTYAFKAYRAMSLIQTSGFVSLGRFCTKVEQSTCDMGKCTNFAPYLYLITCRRACEVCIRTYIECYPLPLHNAVRLFGLERQALLKLPHMLPWQGIVPETGERRHTELMIDFQSAFHAGKERHGTLDAMIAFGNTMLLESGELSNDQSDDQYYGKEAFNRGASNPQDLTRWMAICAAPHATRSGIEPVERRCCRTCMDGLLYSKEEFARHVDEEDEKEEAKKTEAEDEDSSQFAEEEFDESEEVDEAEDIANVTFPPPCHRSSL